MEQLESEGSNVRMSYQTANKVGSVKTTLNMQDFYDSDESTIADLIENKIKPNTLKGLIEIVLKYSKILHTRLKNIWV